MTGGFGWKRTLVGLYDKQGNVEKLKGGRLNNIKMTAQQLTAFDSKITKFQSVRSQQLVTAASAPSAVAAVAASAESAAGGAGSPPEDP